MDLEETLNLMVSLWILVMGYYHILLGPNHKFNLVLVTFDISTFSVKRQIKTFAYLVLHVSCLSKRSYTGIWG